MKDQLHVYLQTGHGHCGPKSFEIRGLNCAQPEFNKGQRKGFPKSRTKIGFVIATPVATSLEGVGANLPGKWEPTRIGSAWYARREAERPRRTRRYEGDDQIQKKRKAAALPDKEIGTQKARKTAACLRQADAIF